MNSYNPLAKKVENLQQGNRMPKSILNKWKVIQSCVETRLFR